MDTGSGARLYYECQGNPDGPPLLLLHGGLDSIETFNTLNPELGRHHRLIGIDSRGHGKSTLGTLPLSYQRLEQNVVAVLGHLRIERCHVIGHSDGGIAALRLAATGSVRIDTLVTIGAHWTLPAGDPMRARYAEVTAAGWRGWFPDGVAHYQQLNPQPDFDALLTAVVAMWLGNGADAYPDERIARIDSDLLVIRGDENPLVSREHALAMANRVTGARLANLPFSGHCPQLGPSRLGAGVARSAAERLSRSRRGRRDRQRKKSPVGPPGKPHEAAGETSGRTKADPAGSVIGRAATAQ